MSADETANRLSVFFDSDISTFLFTDDAFSHAGATRRGMTRSATTAPVAIPGAKARARTRSQRHTNFTPPRSYAAAVESSMVRSKSAGSLSTAVSFLVSERVHPKCSQGVMFVMLKCTKKSRVNDIRLIARLFRFCHLYLFAENALQQ